MVTPAHTIDRALAHPGSCAQAAEALGVSRVSVRQWRAGILPKGYRLLRQRVPAPPPPPFVLDETAEACRGNLGRILAMFPYRAVALSVLTSPTCNHRVERDCNRWYWFFATDMDRDRFVRERRHVDPIWDT